MAASSRELTGLPMSKAEDITERSQQMERYSALNALMIAQRDLPCKLHLDQIRKYSSLSPFDDDVTYVNDNGSEPIQHRRLLDSDLGSSVWEQLYG